MTEFTSSNLQIVRNQMVTQQVRAWNVVDDQVLSVLREVPREPFMPAALRSLAYADLNLPASHGQVVLAPKMEGRILQALALQPTEQVLLIGASNAHLAACAAKLAHTVTVLDSDALLLETARQQALSAGLNNVTIKTADPLTLTDKPLYDAIIVTGALPTRNGNLEQMLKVGGRLFVVLGKSPAMEACVITRNEQSWRVDMLFETELPLLNAAAASTPFVF